MTNMILQADDDHLYAVITPTDLHPLAHTHTHAHNLSHLKNICPCAEQRKRAGGNDAAVVHDHTIPAVGNIDLVQLWEALQKQ
jgi:hypothetical protein